VLAYRWGVAQELLDPAALERLRVVAGLRRGSGGAKEGRSVQPVSAGDFERTVEVLPPTAAAVARLQWWTGMRPGEACRMRAGDVDRAGDVWVYAVRPDANKAEHRGRSRQVMIGPRGREVLRPWLDAQPDPEGYVFRPRGGRRAYYYPRAYWNEVSKACRKAGVGPWHPNRIRHAFARRVATEHGIEAARILMGHATEAMTMHYAKLAPATAARVAAASG
jgi:integrase